MVKINLGKELDFGKPIDLGDKFCEQSKNVKIVQKVVIPTNLIDFKNTSKDSSQISSPTITKSRKKKIDLGKELELGKKVNLGRRLCL